MNSASEGSTPRRAVASASVSRSSATTPCQSCAATNPPNFASRRLLVHQRGRTERKNHLPRGPPALSRHTLVIDRRQVPCDLSGHGNHRLGGSPSLRASPPSGTRNRPATEAHERSLSFFFLGGLKASMQTKGSESPPHSSASAQRWFIATRPIRI